METFITETDRELIAGLTAELHRRNDEAIPDVLLTNTEAARYLGVSLATVGLMIAQGRLTRRTFGKVTGLPLRAVVEMKKTRNRREARELP